MSETRKMPRLEARLVRLGVRLGPMRPGWSPARSVSGRTREKQSALTGEEQPSVVGTVLKAVVRKR